jgi:hypothetical protein
MKLKAWKLSLLHLSCEWRKHIKLLLLNWNFSFFEMYSQIREDTKYHRRYVGGMDGVRTCIFERSGGVTAD